MAVAKSALSGKVGVSVVIKSWQLIDPWDSLYQMSLPVGYSTIRLDVSVTSFSTVFPGLEGNVNVSFTLPLRVSVSVGWMVSMVSFAFSLSKLSDCTPLVLPFSVGLHKAGAALPVMPFGSLSVHSQSQLLFT